MPFLPKNYKVATHAQVPRDNLGAGTDEDASALTLTKQLALLPVRMHNRKLSSRDHRFAAPHEQLRLHKLPCKTAKSRWLIERCLPMPFDSLAGLLGAIDCKWLALQ